MRIQNRQNRRALGTPGKAANRLEVTPVQGKDFPDTLRQQHAVDWQENLEKLLAKLEETGQRLVKNFSISDLRMYKETLRNFLHETLGKAYDLKEATGWTRQGRPKVYQRLELINQELEELSRLVLSQQKDPVKIIAKMDSIRGILLDLYS